MDMPQDRRKYNFGSFLIVIAAFIGLIVFGMGAMGNGDPLWFIPTFRETAGRIIVCRSGCCTERVEGQPGFRELNDGINQTLSQVSGFDMTYGISPESLKNYRDQYYSVEVRYPHAVTIHTTYQFGHPDSLFIPLNQYLQNSAFGGRDGDYWAGALHIKTIDPIKQAADKIACP